MYGTLPLSSLRARHLKTAYKDTRTDNIEFSEWIFIKIVNFSALNGLWVVCCLKTAHCWVARVGRALKAWLARSLCFWLHYEGFKISGMMYWLREKHVIAVFFCFRSSSFGNYSWKFFNLRNLSRAWNILKTKTISWVQNSNFKLEKIYLNSRKVYFWERKLPLKLFDPWQE